MLLPLSFQPSFLRPDFSFMIFFRAYEMNLQAERDLKRESNQGQDDLHLTTCHQTLLQKQNRVLISRCDTEARLYVWFPYRVKVLCSWLLHRNPVCFQTCRCFIVWYPCHKCNKNFPYGRISPAFNMHCTYTCEGETLTWVNGVSLRQQRRFYDSRWRTLRLLADGSCVLRPLGTARLSCSPTPFGKWGVETSRNSPWARFHTTDLQFATRHCGFSNRGVSKRRELNGFLNYLVNKEAKCSS